MESNHDLTQYLPQLRLSRLADEAEAGLWIASLPWPRSSPQTPTLESHPTSILPLGQWPDEPEGTPRRLLLMADGGNSAPQHIALSADTGSTPQPVGRIRADMELFERSPDEEYVWERHLLRLCHNDKAIGLALGLRTGDEVHWWEACRLVVLVHTEHCLVLEMGGAIPHVHMDWDEFKQYPGLTNPYLHKHNWLSGRLYVRLHSNGVCEVYAHHINNKFADDGLGLKDAVPVIGLLTDTTTEETAPLCGIWDGTRGGLELDGVRFDLSEAARLATPEQPGNISHEGNFLVWQPYQGMELYGGDCPTQLTGDPFIFKAEDHIVPRGMARTLRFSLSLSDRSPRIARYLAPAWWYGVCEEFMPEPLLPVSNIYDERTNLASQWLLRHTVHGGFEDGSVARYSPTYYGGKELEGEINDTPRLEPGWEGEVPYAQFLRAWRTGDAREYSAAMRSAYYCTDVSLDHATKTLRMHGYPPPAVALPMNRVQGSIAAYLETGDPYLIEAAQAVVTTSYWQHKNSWPRLAVGRDAYFSRSAMLLYRYCGDDAWRKLALDVALDVAESQRANGSFGDQGGGSGTHQWSGHMTKPWMCLTAVGGVLDYLELFPEEPRLLQCVRKVADWLMAERFDHDGILTWSFQHDYGGKRHTYNPVLFKMINIPGPEIWHQETLGRLLFFCSLSFDEPAYFDAWAESYEAKPAFYDHSASVALQFIPWVQAKLWQATLSRDGLDIQPVHLGPRTPDAGRIMTPDAIVERSWNQTELTAAAEAVPAFATT